MAENKEKSTDKLGFFTRIKNFFVRIGKSINKFFRDYLSEMKKVVWMPWRDVKKNTVLVIVTVLLFGVAIGIVDTTFSEIIAGIAGLIG